MIASLAMMIFGTTAGSLAAQSAMQRPGIAIGIGIGAGTLDGRCKACTAPSTAAVDREITVTYVRNARLQFGATVAGAVGAAKGYGEHEAAILGTVRIYPVVTRPIHLDLSVGHGRYRVSRETVSGTQELRSSAFAWSVGAGWDLPAGLDLTFTPTVTLRRTTSSALKLDGSPLADAGTSVVSFGVALRWRAIPFVPAPEQGVR